MKSFLRTSAFGKNVANALVGLHAFTGSDTVSAFAGKGKVTLLKLASKNEKYISAHLLLLDLSWR